MKWQIISNHKVISFHQVFEVSSGCRKGCPERCTSQSISQGSLNMGLKLIIVQTSDDDHRHYPTGTYHKLSRRLSRLQP